MDNLKNKYIKVIQIELIEIAEKTNIPEISKKIDEQKKLFEEKKEETKINQPIQKPKEEISNEKVKDPSESEKIEKARIEEKMLQNKNSNLDDINNKTINTKIIKSRINKISNLIKDMKNNG